MPKYKIGGFLESVKSLICTGDTYVSGPVGNISGKGFRPALGVCLPSVPTVCD